MQQNCSENELSAFDPCAVAIAFHHHSKKAVKWEGIWTIDYEGRGKKKKIKTMTLIIKKAFMSSSSPPSNGN